MEDDEVRTSRHLAAPFGWGSRCLSFHRVGEFLAAVMTRLLKPPTGRYVDECVGPGRSDIRLVGGRCMGAIMILLGFLVVPPKSEDDNEDMVVLGHQVQVDDEV